MNLIYHGRVGMTKQQYYTQPSSSLSVVKLLYITYRSRTRDRTIMPEEYDNDIIRDVSIR